MRDYHLTLNGEAEPVAAVGNFIFLKSATGTLSVRAGDAFLDLNQGQGVTLPDVFKEITVQGTGDFTLVVGLGDFKDSTLAGNVSIGGDVRVARADYISGHAKHTIAPGGAFVIGQNPKVISILIKADKNNKTDLKVCQGGASYNFGMPISPGEYIIIETTGDWSVYVDPAATSSESFYVLEHRIY